MPFASSTVLVLLFFRFVALYADGRKVVCVYISKWKHKVSLSVF